MRPAGSSPSPADPERTPARPTQVAFDPTRLGRPRGRPDPALIVALAVVVFLGLALLKPWDRPDQNDVASLASAAPSATPPVTASLEPSGPAVEDPGPTPRLAPIPASGPPAATWSEVVPALREHDGWGVRALVDAPNLDGGIRPVHATLVEHWEAAAPAIDGAMGSSLGATGTVSEAVLMPTGGQPVRVLGITAPPGRTPLEARVWWLWPDAPPRWVDVRPVDPSAPGGHLLLLPPRLPDGTASRWPEGTYRVDLLIGSEVVRLTVLLPRDRPTRGDPLDPFASDEGPLIPPLLADLVGLAPGPFVIAGGAPVSVDAPLVSPIEEAGAWLDLESGEPPRRAVDSVWRPSANGIGFALAVGARLEWAALVRLAPVPLAGVEAASRPFFDLSGPFSTVVFSPHGDEAWPTGTYALDVRWSEEGVRHEGRWHLDLAPGPVRRSAAWTTSVRGWARHAGTWGVVSGTADPLEGGPSGVAIRLHPQVPGSVAPRPEVLGEACTGGALLDASRPVIGIAHPADVAIDAIGIERLFVGGRTLAQPAASAASVLPGLSIVGPTAERAIAPGYYRISIDPVEGPAASLVVCLGEARRALSIVDPATASLEAYEAALAAAQAMASTTR